MPSRKSAGPCSRASDRSAATGRVSWTEAMEGFRRMLPVTLYVVPMGLAFAAPALQQDLSAPLAILMSAVVFAGSSQFAALDLWSASPALVPLPAHHLRRQRPPCVARRLPGTLAQQAVALAPLRHRLLLSDPNWALVTQIRTRPAVTPTRAGSRICSSAPASPCGRHGCSARLSASSSAATSATSPGSGSIFSSSPSSLPCSRASGEACGRICCHGSRPPPWPWPAPGCCPAAGTC